MIVSEVVTGLEAEDSRCLCAVAQGDLHTVNGRTATVRLSRAAVFSLASNYLSDWAFRGGESPAATARQKSLQ